MHHLFFVILYTRKNTNSTGGAVIIPASGTPTALISSSANGKLVVTLALVLLRIFPSIQDNQGKELTLFTID